jgi:nicotinamidase-related amidase
MEIIKQALLVIDVQNEYFSGKLPVTYPPGSLANIAAAIDAANLHGIPVIVIQHTAARPDSPTFVKGSVGWQLHPEIAKRKYSELFQKSLPSSFAGTGLEAWLKEQGITTLVISGYMTQMCCDTTAREAFHRGYTVKFLSDATGTLDYRNDAGTVTAECLHKTILIVQRSRFSTVMTTAAWLQSLKS